MSPIQVGDLFLCQRGATQYKVVAENLQAPGSAVEVAPGTGTAIAGSMSFSGGTGMSDPANPPTGFIKGQAGGFTILDGSRAIMQTGEVWEWIAHRGPSGTAGAVVGRGSGAAVASGGGSYLSGSLTVPLEYTGDHVVLRIYKADEGWKDVMTVPVKVTP